MNNLLFLLLCFYVNFNNIICSTQEQPRVCVIGAGISGLSVAYNLQKAGLRHFDVYEASDHIGGTWYYDDRLGQDEQGYPIHSSMYKSLRTNLPRETMEFPDLPMPPEISSFPTQSCFYNYIQAFADHFNLRKYVKFSHRVSLVTRDQDHWKVEYHKLSGKDIQVKEYDYILICNGHNYQPNWPDDNDEFKKNFTGIITHSHDYRDPDIYKDKKVLIVGAGPSAWDIGLEIATVASKLIHSHHFAGFLGTPFPNNYFKKPDIESITNSTVVFDDNSSEDVDVIVFCTGYQYYYPFLDDTSGLTLALQYVAPLHRNTVNIKQPTMLFFGLGVHGVVTGAIHVQARYAASLIIGNFSLPPTEVMMEEWQKQADAIKERGKPLKVLHDLGPKEKEYFQGLTEEAKIPKLPHVIVQVVKVASQAKLANWFTFRLYNYRILNETAFKVYYSPEEKGCDLSKLLS